VAGLVLSAVETLPVPSLVPGVCEGVVAALFLEAADWLPPLIDLSEVDGVVAARSGVVARFCVEAELFCVVEGRFCVDDERLGVVEGRL
jgi:hypothetical protein